MKWFRKQTAPAGASVQLREAGHHPFGLLGQYVPMRSGEIRLYRAVREAVPVVDAAVLKLVRLVQGHISIDQGKGCLLYTSDAADEL